VKGRSFKVLDEALTLICSKEPCGRVRAGPSVAAVRLIVETHSDHVLNGVRLA
jgi:hypothetical protein